MDAPLSQPTPLPHRERSGLPRYQRLAEQIRQDIEAGRYAVGGSLPTEAELGAHYALSRHTVREALRRLADLGLIERRQGSGTRVIAATPPVAYVHTIRALSELFSYTRDTTLAVSRTAQAVLDASTAALLKLPVGTRWVRIDGVRWSADRTEQVGWVTIYVHTRFAGILDEIGPESGPIYARIEARSGECVAEALQEITATAMPAAAAKALGVKRGSPALRIVRRYLDASGGPMLVAVNWHRAETFTYAIRLRRDEEPLPP
jgi:DNA-binding GntR family transcriptional regulator